MRFLRQGAARQRKPPLLGAAPITVALPASTAMEPISLKLKLRRIKVDEYLRLLDTLYFTMCISGHAKAKSKEALYAGMLEE